MLPRPNRLDHRVLTAFTKKIEPRFREIVGAPEDISFLILGAITRNIGGQAFDHLHTLRLTGLPISDALASFYIAQWNIALEKCVDEAVRVWVLDEGVRVPCKEEAKISFEHPSLSGLSYGEVIAVLQNEGKALVKVVFAGGDAKHLWVAAEDIKSVQGPDKNYAEVDVVRQFVGFRKEA